MESPIKRSRDSKKGRLSSEINNTEHVNAQLKGKLKLLAAEMKDAVERMNSMTAEMNTIRSENLVYKDRIAELDQENALLVSQMEEMANERAERDAIIEEFGSAVEARIVEWKEIIDEKDSTIAKLKENLMYATTDRLSSRSMDGKSQAEVERLIQDIDRRDEIIAELQSKLSEAVVEINENSLLIEKFKTDMKSKDSSKRNGRESREISKKMQDANKRISTLESLLERAEKDARVKSEELCEALAILNKYEDENSSLAEALQEIKGLKDQAEKKNKHIEDLIEVVNRLEEENSRFEEEIIVLRDKLGLDENEDSTVDDLILQRQQAQEEKDEEVQRGLNQLNSENVDLKFQIRKLKNALKEAVKLKRTKTNGISSDGENVDALTHRSESKKDHIELLQIRENVKWIVEENEALRQGMQEILDCIHHQDGNSIVTIQSQTLENLLQALDARHVAGWYHPAMRLQGRVNYLQGSNAELRAQLQQIRKNQLLLQGEMQQRSSSVEEGECLDRDAGDSSQLATEARSESRTSPSGQSRLATPKSARSAHSQNADSGRASGKAAESDEILREEAGTLEDPLESRDVTPSDEDDEGFAKKSEEVYAMAKELIAQESEFKRLLSNSEARQRLLESQVVLLRKSLLSSVPPEVHDELRAKHLETSMRLRALLEDKLAFDTDEPTNRPLQELRNELVSLHKQLSELVAGSRDTSLAKTVGDLESRLSELRAENEKLRKVAEVAQEEAAIHRAIDSTVLSEFNELRQRILRFEVEGALEVGETARLSLELANYKVIETELRQQKKLSDREVSLAREELAELRSKLADTRSVESETSRSTDCSDHINVIDFLQQQYAGSTTLSAWERYEASLNKLNNDRNEVKELVSEINKQNENLKAQHEALTNRLQIVEQLKDMLEQQIGSNDVQDVMQRFTIASRQALAESTYKTQISQLQEEIEKTKASALEYEAKLEIMECEIIKVQKAWKVQKMTLSKAPLLVDKVTETEETTAAPKSMAKLTATKSTQIELKNYSREIQCELINKSDVTSMSPKIETTRVQKEIEDESKKIDEENQECMETHPLKTTNVAILQEQLTQALSLASERSVALSKYESQMAEYRARHDALTQLLEEKSNSENNVVGSPDSSVKEQAGLTSAEALQSTIKSLEAIVAQKQETIARYQGLLKEDRDKHSEAAARHQEEIKNLRRQITEARVSPSNGDKSTPTEGECPERDLPGGERREEAALLREKISRLETELGISAELAERWHRLAEDRLRHMDSTRARLNEQHLEEIDSYRKELNKKQRELDELRRQVSESRLAPTTKTEVLSFMKALQIKDNRLADEIENELEEHAVVSSQRLSTTYDVEEPRILEIGQSQSQLDTLRKQLQTSMERERSCRNEIAELQRQLSRRYMAVKAQEKKASRREMQLERKVKELEEELREAKEMLDRHFAAQQAKRAKTAEDLGLWDKLKKWQQTAERLKEKLKEKSDECVRLQNNYDKLRSLIACMEREKWYLRGRCRSETVTVAAWPSSPELRSSVSDGLVEDLQRECQELRERVKELVNRLARQEIEREVEKKGTATTIAFEETAFESDEIRRLREMHDILEKDNLRLETENFELRLELERISVNTPRFQEKIEHLEKYILLLQSSMPRETLPEKSEHGPVAPRRDGGQRTKSELERTVVALKKLVEKLQLENKRLRGVGSCPNSERGCSPYLHDDHERALRRVADLEAELALARKRIADLEEPPIDRSDEDSSEIELMRQQLLRKNQLLLRVKDLLAKATVNEKALRQRIQQLEYKQTLCMIPECETSLGMT